MRPSSRTALALTCVLTMLSAACAAGDGAPTPPVAEEGSTTTAADVADDTLEFDIEPTLETMADAEWQQILVAIDQFEENEHLSRQDLVDGWLAATAFVAEQDPSGVLGRPGGAFGSSRPLQAVGPSLGATSMMGAFIGMDLALDRDPTDSGGPRDIGTKEEVVREQSGVTLTRRVGGTIEIGHRNGVLITESTTFIVHTAVEAATGRIVFEHRSSGRGRFEVRYCPDLDGVAIGSITAEFTEGTYTQRTELRLSGQADGEAYLAGVEVRGTTTNEAGGRRNETVYRRGQALGRTDRSPNTDITYSAVESGIGGIGVNGEAMAVWMAMIDMMSQQLLEKAEKRWRGGQCLELRTEDVRDSNTVAAGSTTTFLVELRHRFDDTPVSDDIAASLLGAGRLDPVDTEEPSPVQYSYIAGSDSGDKGYVDLESVSNRGIASRSIGLSM